MTKHWPFCVLFILIATFLQAQPEPCGTNPAMTSFCDQACVICDIDGFSGINDLTAQGQSVPGFCTTQYNNMQFIAFIAGSVDLTIRVDVGTCLGGVGSLEVGFFYSEDCQNFIPITDCDTDIESNQSQTFSNNIPLIVGQHYYMIIDGSGGSNCDWVFNVVSGSTKVLTLEDSGEIVAPLETCPGNPTSISNSGVDGAALFYWTIDGELHPDLSQDTELTFDEEGTYNICVSAANACDEAAPICTTINVREPQTNRIVEVLCDGECLEVNGETYCNTGTFIDTYELPSGCDSVIIIDIEVLPQPQSTYDVWICNDEEFFIGTDGYSVTGEYTGTVLTANDCDSLVFLDLLVIECEIIGIPEEIPVICKGTATGTLVFSVEQGTPPLNFTYTNIQDVSITGAGTTQLLVNNQIPNIPAGEYQIYIEDDFGNDVVVLQTVTEPTRLEIELVPSDYDGFNVSCFTDEGNGDEDGTLSANVLGGVPPYNYEWSDGQTNQTAEGLTHSLYTVTVTDDVGCTIESEYEMTSPEEIISDVLFNDPTCEGFETGEIIVQNTTGGIPPYLYSLNNSTFNSDSVFNLLVEGSYTLIYQDNNKCIGSITSIITAPEIPVITFADDLEVLLGDSISIIAQLNNITISEVNWTNTETLNCENCIDPIARPVNDTEYTITVTSIDGCTDAESINISVEKRRRLYVPNIFSPNDNSINNIFTINGGTEVASINYFNIYDRWGNLVFVQSNIPVNDRTYGWDGTFNQKDINAGVYIWNAEILFIDGISLQYSGNVSIVK